jgi:transcription-repair coupling factor (superfamily II helicase)
MLLRGGSGSTINDDINQNKQNVKTSIEMGDCQIVVGTHAILQSDIKFKNLGLLVIDEEQVR